MKNIFPPPPPLFLPTFSSPLEGGPSVFKSSNRVSCLFACYPISKISIVVKKESGRVCVCVSFVKTWGQKKKKKVKIGVGRGGDVCVCGAYVPGPLFVSRGRKTHKVARKRSSRRHTFR